MTSPSAVGGTTLKRLISTPNPKPAVPMAGTPTPADAAAVPGGNAGLLGPRDVARLLGISAKALEKWRSQGRGPAVMRLTSKTLRYHIADVEAYITSSRSS